MTCAQHLNGDRGKEDKRYRGRGAERGRKGEGERKEGQALVHIYRAGTIGAFHILVLGILKWYCSRIQVVPGNWKMHSDRGRQERPNTGSSYRGRSYYIYSRKQNEPMHREKDLFGGLHSHKNWGNFLGLKFYERMQFKFTVKDMTSCTPQQTRRQRH